MSNSHRKEKTGHSQPLLYSELQEKNQGPAEASQASGFHATFLLVISALKLKFLCKLHKGWPLF